VLRSAVELLEHRYLYAQTTWWTLDEGSGTTAADSSGNALSLTLTGSPTWVASGSGRVGGALSFNNTTGQYATGNTNVANSSTLSVSAWLKPNALPSSTFIPIDKTPNDATGGGFRLEINSNGSLSFRIGSGSTFGRVSSAAGLATAGNWVQVVATYSAGTATLYVNGAQVAQSTGLAVTTQTTGASVRLGMPSVFSNGFGFNGAIDEVRFYDTLISPNAITNQYSVDLLPEATTANKLKKTTLSWAVEDAIRDEDAGFTNAASTYTDIQNLLGSNIGTPQASPANLFPAIPNIASNPIYNAAVTQLTTLRNSTYFPPKDPTNYTANATNGDVFGDWSSDGVEGAYALGQTQNPYYADPKLLRVVLRRFQACYEGTPYVGYNTTTKTFSSDPTDFFNSAAISQMYVMFKTVYPDLILPSKKTQWETTMLNDAQRIVTLPTGATRGNEYLGTNNTDTWFNSDIQFIYALRWYGETFPTATYSGSTYRQIADSGMSLLLTTMYPDGGAPYVTKQNEVYTYHGIGVNMASRYYQAFGYLAAREIFTKEYWYYPLSTEPPGVPEYSMAASWKHYWNQVTGADSAYIVGAMNNSPENMAVYRMYTNGGDATKLGNAATLNLASYYTTSVANGTLQDNYITYDRNLMGARGRFGRWSFSMTANPVAGDNRGKLTLVGAMYLDAPPANGSTAWTLNAGLDSAGTWIRTNSAGTTIANGTQNETNSYTVTDDFAAVASVGNPGAYKTSALTGWQGSQAWIQTANRIVGLVGIRATSNQTTYAVNGAIDLVSGRATWGTQKLFTQLTSNTYQYGNLIIRLVETNYASVTNYYTSTWGNDGANKTGILQLSDASSTATGGTTASTYAAGFSQFYLVEIYPTSSSQAQAITRIQAGAPGTGLQGFELTDQGKNLRIIDNPTDNTLTYTASLTWTGGAIVHTSGEQYRPAFLSTYNPPDTDFRGRFASPTVPYGIAAGNVSITIAPHTHIVLESNLAPTITSAAAPGNATVTATSTTLSVGASDDGGASNLSYAWSASGPGSVTFSSGSSSTTTALFSAAGTYTFTAKITDIGGLTNTSTTTVRVTQTPTAITLSPASASVQVSTQTTFAAARLDQFSNAISPSNITFTATGGTITGAGVYTAGATPGKTYSVTASSTGLSPVSASVIVRPVAPTFSSLKISDGSAQRSKVTSLTLTFSSPVNLPLSALALTRRTNAFTGGLALSPASGLSAAFTVTFTGSDIISASLADGVYDLALSAGAITDDYNQPISNPPAPMSFHRLFGDVNGDGKIDAVDTNAFTAAYAYSSPSPNYKWYFDYDGNLAINNTDLLQLRKRTGTRLF
jgi:hypothetical protein